MPVINSHPSVREVAVIGIPDEKRCELVTALIVLDPDEDPSSWPSTAEM